MLHTLESYLNYYAKQNLLDKDIAVTSLTNNENKPTYPTVFEQFCIDCMAVLHEKIMPTIKETHYTNHIRMTCYAAINYTYQLWLNLPAAAYISKQLNNSQECENICMRYYKQMIETHKPTKEELEELEIERLSDRTKPWLKLIHPDKTSDETWMTNYMAAIRQYLIVANKLSMEDNDKIQWSLEQTESYLRLHPDFK